MLHRSQERYLVCPGASTSLSMSGQLLAPPQTALLACQASCWEASQLEELGSCMDLCLSALRSLARIQAQAPQLARPGHLSSWMELIAYASQAFEGAGSLFSRSLGQAPPSAAVQKVLAGLAEALALTLDHIAAMGPLAARLPPARLESGKLEEPSLEACASTLTHLCALSSSPILKKTLELACSEGHVHRLDLLRKKLDSASRSMSIALEQNGRPGGSMWQQVHQAAIRVVAAADSRNIQDCGPAWDCTWLTLCLEADPSLQRR